MSSGTLILPSANRGHPRVVTQSPSGIIAYACRYSIYFIDARCSPPLILDSKFVFKAHTGKIISLSFCKNEGTELLSSISDNRELKVWDVESKTCLATVEVREYCRLSEWLYGSPNILVYPSDYRSIIKSDFEEGVNGTHKIKTGSDATVTQLVSNEKSPHLLAIGYMNGLIIVMDIAKEIALQKLKVHSMEITSLSWSPIVPDNLLSVSLDLSLRMWKVGENQPLWSYYMPSARQKYEDKRKLRIAGICHPRNPNTVICSNLRGDVGEVVYSETEKPKFSFYYQGSCDLNCKSTFAFFLVTMEEGKTDLLYCFDPFKITLWNVTEKRLFGQIPFMGQFVYDLTVSNVNPNLLAISNGEGLLKVWNSLSEATKMDTISVYVHVKTRIMTTAWHPTSENIIAYATYEGRVGVIDIFKRKTLYSFETHHSGPVYSLNWAPCERLLNTDKELLSSIDAEKTIYFIYSCGGGVVYINRENDAKGKAKNFDDLVEHPAGLDSTENSHSELSWKSDFSCFCVGSFKGYIDLYYSTFLFVMRFNVQMKTVECLRWHPESTYMSPDGSNLKSWLACSGNDEEIHIIDTLSYREQDNVTQGALKKLVGHNKRVVSLCWSQHKDGFLVSASKDGSALVWDVLAGTIIATYLSHQDVVFAVQWSVFDPDVIYSGGQDCSVRIWKISEQSATTPPTKAPRRKRMLKPTTASKKKTDASNSEEEDNDVEENNLEIKKKATKTDSSNQTMVKSEKTLTEDESASTFSIAAKSQIMLPKKCVLFPHFATCKATTNEDLDDCIKLADILSANSTAYLNRTNSFDSLKSIPILNDEEVIKFGIFSDQLTAMRMMEIQADLLKSAGDLHSARCLQLMAGNIQSTIEEAAKTKSLNFFLVSLAPSVSHSFWLQMCEKFAEQLFEQYRFAEASFYYLTCGKIYEAIKVLAEKGNVIDALALAKARLPESDPLIPQILLRARKRFFEMRSTLGEVKCYMSMDQPLVAAKTIASSNDPDYIRVAAYICKKFQLDKDAENYRFLCMEKCLANFNYSAFKQLATQEPCMQVYGALVSVHEALHHHIKLLKKSDGISIKELFLGHEAGNEIQFWKGNTYIDSKKSFIASIHQHLLSQELLNTDKSTLLNHIDALDTLFLKKNTFGTAEVHVTVAIYLTKFIILSLLQDVDVGTTVFLKIFDASNNIVFLPKIMCSLFFPMCLSWKKDTSQMLCTSVTLEEAMNNNVILEAIYSNFCEKITCYMKQPIEMFITPEDLLSNLRFITDRIAVILDIKKVQEHLLGYFVSSLINDLTRCILKMGLRLKCYKTSPVKEKSPMLIGKQTKQNLETSTVTCESVSENVKEAENIDELINLAIHEAEEKAKSLTKQEAPVHANEDISSGESQFKNPADIVATNISNVEVVQYSSEIDGSLVVPSIVNVAIVDEEITSKINNNISNNEGLIENSNVMSNGDVSYEKIVLPSDEHKSSDNDNTLDEDLPKNESLVSECDTTKEIDMPVSETVYYEKGIVSKRNALPNNECAVSSDTFLEEEDLVKPVSNNMVPKVDDLSNCEVLNIINEEKVVPSNELFCLDNSIESKNKVSEGGNLPENELIISDSDIISVKSEEPNNELDLPNSGLIIEKVDQHNIDMIPDGSIIHEEIMILNNGVNEKIILEVNKDAISNSIASEALIQPEIKDDIQEENEDLKEDTHKQCLENVDVFYNIISFITQNICKDEFALLFYLKERVKFLYQARAAEALDKFSKEKKANASSKKIKKIDSLKRKTSGETKDSNVLESKDFNLKSQESVGLTSETCTNNVDGIVASLDVQSLKGEEMKKIDGPDSVSEDARKIDGPNSISEGEEKIVGPDSISEGEEKIASLDSISEGEEKIASPDSISEGEEKIASPDSISEDVEKIDDPNSVSENVGKIDGPDSISEDVRKNDRSDSISVDLENIDSLDIISEDVGEIHASDTISEDVGKDDGPDSNTTTSTVSANELHGKVENICDEHNYCSPKENGENASISHYSSNGIRKDVDTSPSSNLQNELEEILELVCILEKKSEKFCYPNPFDAIPKILRALYYVAQNSSCKCVQEKLHLFIHEIVCWAERYNVGEINFVCQICQKTSVM